MLTLRPISAALAAFLWDRRRSQRRLLNLRTKRRVPRDFEDAIAALDKTDPNARSRRTCSPFPEYADALAGSAGNDCRQRLDKAQSILDGVGANPAFVVALPGGRAREENTEYRIHLARASLRRQPPSRDSELREALGAAQRAVELYRDALDYQSAAISQFNAASTHRLLGDGDLSIASLEIAIDMDREYGFRQDAEDNNQLLMRWKAGDGAAADSAAGRMRIGFSTAIRVTEGWVGCLRVTRRSRSNGTPSQRSSRQGQSLFRERIRERSYSQGPPTLAGIVRTVHGRERRRRQAGWSGGSEPSSGSISRVRCGSIRTS